MLRLVFWSPLHTVGNNWGLRKRHCNALNDGIVPIDLYTIYRGEGGSSIYI